MRQSFLFEATSQNSEVSNVFILQISNCVGTLQLAVAVLIVAVAMVVVFLLSIIPMQLLFSQATLAVTLGQML